MCHPLLFIEPLNRLTEANYSNGDYYHYTYDAVGNRLSQTTQSSVTSYLYDNANRLFDVNGVTYTWDDNGNLLSDGTNTYTYTSNKLSSISGENLNVTFQYRCNGESSDQWGIIGCESERVSQTVN
jgi:YD repeat-containing protein